MYYNTAKSKKIEDSIRNIVEHDGNMKVSFEYDKIDVKPNYPIGALVDVDYQQDYKKCEVIAITTNLTTNESFLLYIAVEDTFDKCLDSILNYVSIDKSRIDSYTVNWSKIVKGNIGEYNTSYFYCENPMEVLRKFYNGKNPKDYIIYNIKLNAIS